MTYMGHDYYPQWLDNLAADVTFEAAAMDGTAHGAADVRSIVVTAKELYENQQFSYAGPCGDNGFLELYTTEIRGVPTRVVVVVSFNDTGQTQEIVVNHRPRSALLSFSRVMLEKFAGTPLAKHWEGTPWAAFAGVPRAVSGQLPDADSCPTVVATDRCGGIYRLPFPAYLATTHRTARRNRARLETSSNTCLPMPPEPLPLRLALFYRRTASCLYCTVPRISGRR